MARALASIVFLRADGFPLIVNRDDRVEYIESLEQADQGDLGPLVNLFARTQKKAFNQALRLLEQIDLSGDPLQQIIAAATERLKDRKRISSEQITLSHHLEEFAKQKLSDQAARLREALRSVDPTYNAFVTRSSEQNAANWEVDARSIAHDMGYQADLDTYHAWLQLNIAERHTSQIVVSFHPMGAEFLGLMAISAWSRLPTLVPPVTHLSMVPFQFSLQDDELQLKQRLDKWLDDVLLVGLDLWRKQL